MLPGRAKSYWSWVSGWVLLSVTGSLAGGFGFLSGRYLLWSLHTAVSWAWTHHPQWIQMHVVGHASTMQPCQHFCLCNKVFRAHSRQRYLNGWKPWISTFFMARSLSSVPYEGRALKHSASQWPTSLAVICNCCTPSAGPSCSLSSSVDQSSSLGLLTISYPFLAFFFIGSVKGIFLETGLVQPIPRVDTFQ